MDFGIFNVMQQRHRSKSSSEIMRDALELAHVGETLGFSRVWFAEHHFSSYSVCPSPLMMAAYAASRTTRIRLGTAVLVAPLYKPARLAAEIAMVDSLSDGRLDVGFGSGYQQFEFDRFGVDLAKNHEMTEEMLDMVDAALTRPHFTYEGKHFRQPQTAISIRPVQEPRPPFWIAGRDPRLHERAARDGHTPFISSRFSNLAEMRPLREGIDAAFRRAGRDPETMELGCLGYCYIGDTPEAIDNYVDNARYQQRIARSLRERRQMMTDDYFVEEQPVPNEPSFEELRSNMLVGDAGEVTRRLVEFIRILRPTHMSFYFQVGGIPLAEAIRSMERFAGEVVPGIEKAFGLPLAEINRPKRLAAAAGTAAAQ